MVLIAVTTWRRTLPTWVHPESSLYTLNPDYVTGVENAGGSAVVVPHVASDEAAEEMLDHFDGLILSGGADMEPSLYGQENTASFRPDLAADRSDIAFTKAALASGKPLLAICRGAQVLNVAFGGSLIQNVWIDEGVHTPRTDSGDVRADSDAFLDRRHDVDLVSGSLAASLFGSNKISTNSLHHQSVDQLGEGLCITGRAEDGHVEVIEHPNGLAIGVQWHPERLLEDGHQTLFDWVVEASRKTG